MTEKGVTAMMNMVAQTANRFWWLMVLRGILAIIFGLIALVFPGIALLAIIYVFAAYALIDGITAMVVSIQTRNSSSRGFALGIGDRRHSLYYIRRYSVRSSGRWIAGHSLVSGDLCHRVRHFPDRPCHPGSLTGLSQDRVYM